MPHQLFISGMIPDACKTLSTCAIPSTDRYSAAMRPDLKTCEILAKTMTLMRKKCVCCGITFVALEFAESIIPERVEAQHSLLVWGKCADKRHLSRSRRPNARLTIAGGDKWRSEGAAIAISFGSNLNLAGVL
jgi:hypothetical protein